MGVNTYNGYYAGISAEGYVVLGKTNGNWTELRKAATTVSSSKWYKLKVVAIKSIIKVYFDNMEVPIIEINDDSSSEGSIGVRSWNTPVKYDSISVKEYEVIDHSSVDKIEASNAANPPVVTDGDVLQLLVS